MRIGDQSSHADRRVPRLAPDCDPTGLSLSPTEGYLLSRIDGHTSWGLLRQMGGLPAAEIDRCLERWLKEGVIQVDGASQADARSGQADARADARSGQADARRAEADADARSAAAGDRGASPAAPPKRDAPAAEASASAAALPEGFEGIAVDPALPLDEKVQREILAFASRLERPYHEILGVAVDADARTIKKAYFRLSRVLHPDRYFRRDIGPFGPLVERSFRKLLEAYELLSDPATRAEVQRAAEAQAAAPADAGAGHDAVPARARDAARRLRLRALRRAGAGAPPGLAERKRKAKSFFEAGMAAFSAGRWLEAAGAVRLAIAFDAGNEVYRERFVEVQRRAHEERATQLVGQAERALELKNFREALPLLEEATNFRPADAELHMRAAKLAWQLAGGQADELKRARKLAAAAAEIEPERAELRLLLGRIYRDAGLTANARRELEAAASLDPDCAEARAELKSI